MQSDFTFFKVFKSPNSSHLCCTREIKSIDCGWPFHLKHHVKHHGEPALAWVLSGCVQGRQIKQAGARLVANRMDQHLFTHTCGSDQQDRLYQRSLLVYHLRA